MPNIITSQISWTLFLATLYDDGGRSVVSYEYVNPTDTNICHPPYSGARSEDLIHTYPAPASYPQIGVADHTLISQRPFNLFIPSRKIKQTLEKPIRCIGLSLIFSHIQDMGSMLCAVRECVLAGEKRRDDLVSSS
jgi:hypothetical protein